MIPRQPRKNLMLSAAIEAGPVLASVRIRNMSEHGAMIDGAALPEEGSELLLKRLAVSVLARVVWSHSGRCGLRFSAKVCVEEWITGVRQVVPGANLGQLRVDAIQSALRDGDRESSPVLREGLTGGGRHGVDSPDYVPPPFEVDRRIARELASLADLLDAAAATLAGDADIIDRHAEALQNLDIASATLSSLSGVVAQVDRPGAIAQIAMHDLRDRLSGTLSLN